MTPSSPAPTRFLLIKAKGGMGNRMLCAASGILYAALSRRVPAVDWRDFTYSDDGSNVFPRYFDSPIVRPLEELPASDDVHPPVWRGNLPASIGDLIEKHDPDKHSSITVHRKYSVDVRTLEVPNTIAVFWYYTHRLNQLHRHLRRGPVPGIGDASSFRLALSNTLAHAMPLAAPIRAKVDAFAAAEFAPQTIGVHVRYTDLKVDLGAYERGLTRALAGKRDARVFLATDNPTVIEHFRARFRNVITRDKWLPDAGASLHQNKSCPSRFENGVDALIDMYLLARCDSLVFSSRSTFSWIATFLSDRAPHSHIDVDRNNLRHRFKQWVRDHVA